MIDEVGLLLYILHILWPLEMISGVYVVYRIFFSNKWKPRGVFLRTRKRYKEHGLVEGLLAVGGIPILLDTLTLPFNLLKFQPRQPRVDKVEKEIEVTEQSIKANKVLIDALSDRETAEVSRLNWRITKSEDRLSAWLKSLERKLNRYINAGAEQQHSINVLRDTVKAMGSHLSLRVLDIRNKETHAGLLDITNTVTELSNKVSELSIVGIEDQARDKLYEDIIEQIRDEIYEVIDDAVNDATSSSLDKFKTEITEELEEDLGAKIEDAVFDKTEDIASELFEENLENLATKKDLENLALKIDDVRRALHPTRTYNVDRCKILDRLAALETRTEGGAAYGQPVPSEVEPSNLELVKESQTQINELQAHLEELTTKVEPLHRKIWTLDEEIEEMQNQKLELKQSLSEGIDHCKILDRLTALETSRKEAPTLTKENQSQTDELQKSETEAKTGILTEEEAEYVLDSIHRQRIEHTKNAQAIAANLEGFKDLKKKVNDLCSTTGLYTDNWLPSISAMGQSLNKYINIVNNNASWIKEVGKNTSIPKPPQALEQTQTQLTDIIGRLDSVESALSKYAGEVYEYKTLMEETQEHTCTSEKELAQHALRLANQSVAIHKLQLQASNLALEVADVIDELDN